MKQYRVVKNFPVVELGDVYQHMNINELIKGGWISEVSERKTLEEKFTYWYDKAQCDWAKHPRHLANDAKDHYLGLLDEAVKEYHKSKTSLPEYSYTSFLRKYLESEGNMG